MRKSIISRRKINQVIRPANRLIEHLIKTNAPDAPFDEEITMLRKAVADFSIVNTMENAAYKFCASQRIANIIMRIEDKTRLYLLQGKIAI